LISATISSGVMFRSSSGLACDKTPYRKHRSCMIMRIVVSHILII
jgi:hypothetical protein